MSGPSFSPRNAAAAAAIAATLTSTAPVASAGSVATQEPGSSNHIVVDKPQDALFRFNFGGSAHDTTLAANGAAPAASLGAPPAVQTGSDTGVGSTGAGVKPQRTDPEKPTLDGVRASVGTLDIATQDRVLEWLKDGMMGMPKELKEQKALTDQIRELSGQDRRSLRNELDSQNLGRLIASLSAEERPKFDQGLRELEIPQSSLGALETLSSDQRDDIRSLIKGLNKETERAEERELAREIRLQGRLMNPLHPHICDWMWLEADERLTALSQGQQGSALAFADDYYTITNERGDHIYDHNPYSPANQLRLVQMLAELRERTPGISADHKLEPPRDAEYIKLAEGVMQAVNLTGVNPRDQVPGLDGLTYGDVMHLNAQLTAISIHHRAERSAYGADSRKWQKVLTPGEELVVMQAIMIGQVVAGGNLDRKTEAKLEELSKEANKRSK